MIALYLKHKKVCVVTVTCIIELIEVGRSDSVFIFSHFDRICCDGTEGVCMYVCVYMCVCVCVCDSATAQTGGDVAQW